MLPKRARPPSRAEYNRNLRLARKAAGFRTPDTFTPASPDLDLRLELLTRHLSRSYRRPELGSTDLAAIIGCDRRYVEKLTQRALKKLAAALRERRALEDLFV